MKSSKRVYSAYEQEELRKKVVNWACLAGLVIAALLVISLILRPAPSLPPPGGNFKTFSVEIRGRIELPPGASLCDSPAGKCVKGLRMTVEMLDIPLTICRKDGEIVLDREGRYIMAVKDLSVLSIPKTLSVKASLEGHGECVRGGIAISPSTSEVLIPDIVFKSR